MKTVRILSFILAVLMLAVPLASCNLFKQDEPPVEEPVEEETPAAPEVTELSLVDVGITEYVIVRDYQASKKVVDAVANIAAMIKEHTGADIQVKECFNNIENEPLDVETEKEILVGMTNRKESQEALKGLLADDYTMQISGSKLVIGGGGDSGTVKALTVFLTAYIYEQGNKFLVNDKENPQPQSLKFTKEDNVVSRGIYSYSKCQMLGVRIDSFLLAYPKNSEMSQTYKEFAESLQAHISKESGYELEISKDTRAWGDYEILIGDTKRTDAGLYEELGKDEYYIKLVKKQVTYEDGSVHDGGTMYVCFGEDAADAALLAFTKQIMPASTKPLEFSLEDNFVLTNKK